MFSCGCCLCEEWLSVLFVCGAIDVFTLRRAMSVCACCVVCVCLLYVSRVRVASVCVCVFQMCRACGWFTHHFVYVSSCVCVSVVYVFVCEFVCVLGWLIVLFVFDVIHHFVIV